MVQDIFFFSGRHLDRQSKAYGWNTSFRGIVRAWEPGTQGKNVQGDLTFLHGFSESRKERLPNPGFINFTIIELRGPLPLDQETILLCEYERVILQMENTGNVALNKKEVCYSSRDQDDESVRESDDGGQAAKS